MDEVKMSDPELVDNVSANVDRFVQLVRLKIDLENQFEFERQMCLGDLYADQLGMKREQVEALRSLFESL